MKITYEQEIWERAVREAESDVMHCLPILPGGRKEGETIDRYARRCQDKLEIEWARLDIARKNLAEAKRRKV